MKSKTLIGKQAERKNNPELVETILLAKKKDKWVEVAGLLSSPRANMKIINIDELDKEAKEGETILIPGKVLSQGDLNKKIKVAALSFSNKAKEKILKAKGEISTIAEEIRKNPDAKNVRIIK
ncbi:50S ribosomal protein L18e [uncultured archaeon]|nr:50S ribosomal protein L18e [uncultured archaeon]